MKSLSDQFLAHVGVSVTNSTKTVYRNALQSFLARFDDAPSVTTAGILEWIQAEMTAGNNNVNIRFKLGVVKRFFRWMHDQGHIPDQPKWHTLPKLPKLKPRKVPFTEEQFRRVLRTIELHNLPGYLKSACIVGWHTGLRLSDCCQLRRDAISFDDGMIRLVAQKKKRFGEVLEIPMSEELTEHLLSTLNRYQELPDLVFPDLAMHYQSQRIKLEKQFRRLFDLAGLTEHSFHSLRHGFVSRLLNSGTHPLIIASMTGQSLAIIQGYSHVSPEAKRRALNIQTQEKEERYANVC